MALVGPTPALWQNFVVFVGLLVAGTPLFAAGKMGAPVPPNRALIITVATTTVVWLLVTFLTAPTDRATLRAFYEKVRPAGPGWRGIREESGLPPSPDSMSVALAGWVLGCLFVYAALFGTGSFLYGKTSLALVWTAVFVLSGLGLIRVFTIGARNAAADTAR